MIEFESTVTLDTTIAKTIQAALENAAKEALQVGWFGGKPHPDNFSPESQSTIAGVAARNEFGVDPSPDEIGVPKRPFIRPVVQVRTIDDQVRFLKAGYRSIFRGKNTLKSNNQKLGRHIVKELQSAIDNQTFHGKPRNSKRTEKHKGFNKPLTGKTKLMRNTIKYRIVPRDNT